MIPRLPAAARRTAALTAVALAAGATLAACSGSDDHDLGASVEVDFYPSDGGTEPDGSGTVTVTDVRKGATSDLVDAGFSLDPEEEAATAYYVDVTFENTGDTAVTPHDPGGEDPEGNLIHALTIIDLGGPPFERCAGVPEEVPPGEEAEGCTIVLVPEGVEMERIYYHPGGSEDFVYWKTE
jgi:hypothetical protein